jgi:hypothetical protein
VLSRGDKEELQALVDRVAPSYLESVKKDLLRDLSSYIDMAKNAFEPGGWFGTPMAKEIQGWVRFANNLPFGAGRAAAGPGLCKLFDTYVAPQLPQGNAALDELVKKIKNLVGVMAPIMLDPIDSAIFNTKHAFHQKMVRILKEFQLPKIEGENWHAIVKAHLATFQEIAQKLRAE